MLLVKVLLAETEIDQIKVVHPALDSEHKVLWLDVPMDDALAVQVLDAPQHLVRHEDRGLRVEAWRVSLPSKALQPVLEGLAQHLHDQAHEALLLSAPKELCKALRPTWLSHELQDSLLVLQLQRMARGVLELHRDLLVGLFVPALPDLPKTTCTQLLLDLIPAVRHGGRRLRTVGHSPSKRGRALARAGSRLRRPGAHHRPTHSLSF
mmetsp:Transcript_93627/g.222605  ORF Transcript_93627/g.222605 Transcript_93627/m.222605 type:complete len:208 (+) Transcript_93627:735-1358(+)